MASSKKYTETDLYNFLKTHKGSPILRTDASGLTLIIRQRANDVLISFYYRRYEDGVRKEKLLGNFPEMSIDEARLAWLELKQKADKGLKVLNIEPKRITTYEPKSFGAVWSEWRKMRDYSLAERTKEKVNSAWNAHLHFLEDVNVEDLTPAYVLNFLDPYITRGEASTAQRLGKLISGCLDYAVFKQNLVMNPLLNLHKYLPKVKGGHYASFSDENLDLDMKELFNKFSDASFKTQILLYMYFFTLLRSVELRRVKVEDIVGNIMTVKTKTLQEFKVPLSRQAMECVKWLIANKHGYNNPYLFEGMAEDGIISENTLNKELANRGYKDKLKVHGIRACGRQWLQTLPYAKESIIEQCLSHVVGSRTEQAYNRGEYLQERAKLMQEWSDFVEKCIGDNNAFMFK